MIQRWDQNARYTRIKCALDNRLAILIKFIEIQVAMGIGQHSLKDCENYNISDKICHIKKPRCSAGLFGCLFCFNSGYLQSILKERLDFIPVGGFTIHPHDRLSTAEAD